ncbi:MAG: hypothetical protein ACXVRH_06030 [Thermoleophilaceae bacterium]
MRALVTAIAVALVLPGTAAAATTTVMESSSAHFFEPAVAGDSVVADAYRPKEIVDVLVAQPGQKPALLLRVTPPVPHTGAGAHPVASGNQVLVRRWTEGGATDIFSGTLPGPLTKIQSCPQDTNLAFQPPPALDGTLAVWSAGDCNRNHVLVRVGGTSKTIDAGGPVIAVAAGGQDVAWLNRQTSGEVSATWFNAEPPTDQPFTADVSFSIPEDSRGRPLGPPEQLDVDGSTVVLAQPLTGTRSPLCPHDLPAEISVATIVPRGVITNQVPELLCSLNQTVKVGGGRIAFVERLGSGLDQLTTSALDGSDARPVALFEPRFFGTSFDFDGSRVAWTDVRCRSSVVLRRDVADTSAPEPATTCPVKVGSPRLSRDGTLHVAVACPNGCQPDGSSSVQGIQIISPHWLHVVGKTRRVTRYAPFVPFSLAPGKRTVVHLPMTATQRATLRRRGKASVRLKVLLQDVYLPRVIRTARAG